MHWKRMIGMMAVCSLMAVLMSGQAMALVLTGYLPVQQGRFWNFSSSGEPLLSTWAINGTFTERNVGNVFILQQDNAGFSACVRNGVGYTFMENMHLINT